MYGFFFYLSWHYKYALGNLFSLTKEFIRFFFNFFSIGLFAKTLFLPMFSVKADPGKEVYIIDYIAIIISNLFLRVLGFIVRSCFIAIGVLSIVLVSILMTGILFVWVFMPFILFFDLYVLLKLITI